MIFIPMWLHDVLSFLFSAWAPWLWRHLPSCSERRGRKLPNSTCWWQKSKKKKERKRNPFQSKECKCLRVKLLLAVFRGALASRMLLALVCDPKPQTCTGDLVDSEVSCSCLLFAWNYSLHIKILLDSKMLLNPSASSLTVTVPGRCLLSALWAASLGPWGELFSQTEKADVKLNSVKFLLQTFPS